MVVPPTGVRANRGWCSRSSRPFLPQSSSCVTRWRAPASTPTATYAWVVVPPPQMVNYLQAGFIAGYCVWASRRNGSPARPASGGPWPRAIDTWNHHPEKVFAVTRTSRRPIPIPHKAAQGTARRLLVDRTIGARPQGVGGPEPGPVCHVGRISWDWTVVTPVSSPGSVRNVAADQRPRVWRGRSACLTQNMGLLSLDKPNILCLRQSMVRGGQRPRTRGETLGRRRPTGDKLGASPDYTRFHWEE